MAVINNDLENFMKKIIPATKIGFTALMLTIAFTGAAIAQVKNKKKPLKATNDAPPALIIKDNGNVGVGVANPENKLQLGGDIHLDGNSIYFRTGPTDKNDFVRWSQPDTQEDKVDMGGYKGVRLGDTYGGFFPILTVGRARGINNNFTNTPVVDIKSEARSGSHPSDNLPLYVTGPMDDNNGVQFRKSDGTEGIGFSSNFIYQTANDRNLNFRSAGDGNLTFHTRGLERMFVRNDGLVKVNNNFEIGGVLQNELKIGGNITFGHADRNITAVNNGQGTYLEFKNRGTANSNYGFRFTEDAGGYPIMRMRDNFVGIGTDNPQFPLHVIAAKGGNTPGIGGFEINWGGGESPGNRFFSQVSILAEGHIVTQNALISASNRNYSDIRLKKNIISTSSADDLEKLRSIAVMNYKMIDTVGDNKQYKKVIAQQVQQVYPDAVDVSVGTLPDIFQHASSVTQQGDSLYNISIAKTGNIKTGDVIMLKCPGQGDVKATVTTVINGRNFTVRAATTLTGLKDVFVYGHPAKDVLTVDYDAISMLNVSATQQLAKTIDEQQKEIAELKKQVAQLSHMVTALLPKNKDKNAGPDAIVTAPAAK